MMKHVIAVSVRTIECRKYYFDSLTCRLHHFRHLFRGRSLKLSMVVRKLSSLAVFRDMLSKSPIPDQPFAFEANYSEIANDSVNDQSGILFTAAR